ncbi:MAG: hypothetical protein RR202_01215 [Bacteroidales bacterium]
MAKSSAQKVKEIFLRKLLVKIKGMELVIAPELYVELLLDDIILLAENQGNLKTAIDVRVSQGKPRNIMEITLKEVTDDFGIEVKAYMHYLSLLEDKKLLKRDIEAIMMKLVNDEPAHLRARIHEILREHLSQLISEAQARQIGYKKEDLLFLLAYQIENLAKYNSFEDCARVELEGADYTEEQFQQVLDLTIRKYTNFAPSVTREVNAYKLALEMQNQDMEISKILENVKEALL